MILDSFAQFTGGSASPGNNDGSTDSPTTGTQTSSNQWDLGVGTTSNPALPSFASGGGARDLAVGDKPSLKILVEVTTAFTGGTNLQVNLQGAPDNGSGAPGSFTTFITGPTVVEANLVIGARLLEIDLARPPAAVAIPRFLQLQYVSSGTHGAGKLRGNVILDRFDYPGSQTGVLSGYTPGITIAN
jgi:hypothetical protein